ncbi:MAG: hypothetical protein ACI84C_002701 [Flavobacteriales bacterium]|jgi:hypothetical protein
MNRSKHEATVDVLYLKCFVVPKSNLQLFLNIEELDDRT